MNFKSILFVLLIICCIVIVTGCAAAYTPVQSPVLGTKEITSYNGQNVTIALYDHSVAIDAIFANSDMTIDEKFEAEVLQIGWTPKLELYALADFDATTGEPIYEESIIDSILMFFGIIERPDYYNRTMGDVAMNEYLYNYMYNWRGLE